MDIYPVKHTAGDRTPYTYCITHIPSGKRYYGVKWSRGCHPSTFWSDYHTSSKYVKSLLEQDGVESFTFEIRKVFDDYKKACDWEKTVLRRLNIPHNPNWINRSVPRENFKSCKPGEARSKETRAKISASKKGKKQGPRSPEVRARMAEAQRLSMQSSERRARLSLANKGKKKSKETKEKLSSSLKGKPKAPFTQQHKDNIAAAKIGKKRGPNRKT